MEKFGQRLKFLVINGLGVLAVNIIYKNDWKTVIFSTITFIIIALIFPYILNFFGDYEKNNIL